MEELNIPAMRKLISNMIIGAVDKAILGDPLEILWLASDDAMVYYDVLGLDATKVLTRFLRLYLQYKNQSKSWKKFKVQEHMKVSREIRQERKAAIEAGRM